MKLIKLTDDHYIIVDDSEIKKGDYYIHNQKPTGLRVLNSYPLPMDAKKILYSTQPLESYDGNWRFDKVQPLFISEVKELLGEVDVDEKSEKANGYAYYGRPNGEKYIAFGEGYKSGYNQAIKDNKDRRFSEEEVIKLMYWTMNMSIGQRDSGFVHSKIRETLDNKINSLTKDTWEVEIVDGKLKLKP